MSKLSRDPLHLHPEVRAMHAKFVAECEARGIKIITTNTWRSLEQQAELYARGRTSPGKIVTKAKPGQTYHNYMLADGTPSSLAFDIVPVVKGDLVWGTRGVDGALWDYVGAIGESVGLEWGGSWRFKDRPHFQMKDAEHLLRKRFPEAWD